MAEYNSTYMNTGYVGETVATSSVAMGKGEYADTLKLELPSKTLNTTFGREEDYIELHILNTGDSLLYTEPNFVDYTTEGSQNLVSSINIDPEKILIDRKYISGQYKIKLHIHRNKIFNSTYFPFTIKEISPSRREIKVIAEDVDNKLFDESVLAFLLEIESAAYFKEFSLNFGSGLIYPAINLMLNKSPLKHELVLKTLDPLPTTVKKGNTFKVIEEISSPIVAPVDLGGQNIPDGTIELRGPNFQIDTRKKSSIPSKLKNYNEILEYNVTSSYNTLLNKLENPDTINIQYDYVRTVSSSMEEIDRSYHFENFVHFSSATKRLKTFKYKIEQIELQDKKLAEILLITGSLTASNTYIDAKEDIKSKKRDLIKKLDGYEQFLYYTTGSNTYAWPKSTGTKPYELYSVTSSQVTTWLGDAVGDTPDYTGQMLSASLYDRKNNNNLDKLIPQHILDNENNKIYVEFVNLIGHHFDLVWTHIKHISEINNLDNKFGISKHLVYYQLQSLGLDTFDQFENSNLIEYILGEGLQDHSVGNLVIGEYIIGGLGNEFYNAPFGVSNFVTASNEGSIPKGEITREIWKRLYNNSPYLLKTKGTERGLRALMNCYGVPSTILHTKEYGGNTLLSGPLKDLNTAGTYKTFSYDKSGLALKGYAHEDTGYFIKTRWCTEEALALSSSAKTVEFRIKPKRLSTHQNQHLFSLSGSNSSGNKDYKKPFLFLQHKTSGDVSESGDYVQYGQLHLYYDGCSMANTPYFPIFNGEFWNIFIGTPATSGSDDRIHFGAYQANWLKHVTFYTSSLIEPESDRIWSWGDPYYGGTNSSGSDFMYIGGVEANTNPSFGDIDQDGKPFSGSIQEVKVHYHTKGVYEMLSHETLKKHALEPFMYSGNTVSSSYEEVVLRLPLGSNDQQDSGSFHPHIESNYMEFAGVNYSGIESGFIVENYDRRIFSNRVASSQEWEEVVETHHLPTPDTVGASMTSEKVRIDDGTINSDNVLMVDKSAETSTLDRQPPDYEDLGVHFSPTFEMNEDILYSLGSFRLDDYIGSPLPSAQTASAYEDLKEIQEYYVKKLRNKYNYWDYIRIIQEFDHTLFKVVEQFVPFKANTKTGLLIEPTYLERNKIAREVPIRSDGQTMTTGSHQTFELQIGSSNSISFATSSQQTKRGFGCNMFPMQPGCASASMGRWEPGSYVVSYNNLLFTTSSKTSERLERGANTTIEIYDEYLDPFRRKYNQWGALHSNNGQACQAPIKPFVQKVSGLGQGGFNYGIGAATIGPSKGVGFSTIQNGFIVEDYQFSGGNFGTFIVGAYYNQGGGNPSGVGFSGIQNGFVVTGDIEITLDSTVSGGPGTETITSYATPLPSGFFGVGTAAIGSTFLIGSYTVLPILNWNYRTHKSNTLLGNVQTGRKSKKYFKYHTYETQGSSVVLG